MFPNSFLVQIAPSLHAMSEISASGTMKMLPLTLLSTHLKMRKTRMYSTWIYSCTPCYWYSLTSNYDKDLVRENKNETMKRCAVHKHQRLSNCPLFIKSLFTSAADVSIGWCQTAGSHGGKVYYSYWWMFSVISQVEFIAPLSKIISFVTLASLNVHPKARELFFYQSALALSSFLVKIHAPPNVCSAVQITRFRPLFGRLTTPKL